MGRGRGRQWKRVEYALHSGYAFLPFAAPAELVRGATGKDVNEDEGLPRWTLPHQGLEDGDEKTVLDYVALVVGVCRVVVAHRGILAPSLLLPALVDHPALLEGHIAAVSGV